MNKTPRNTFRPLSANVWTEVDSMTQVRTGPGCGVVLDPSTGRAKKIVVAGGRNTAAAKWLSSTEVFDLDTKKWTPGGALSQYD